MADQMVAAVFEGEGRLSLKEVDIPQVRAPDDVLLAVRAVGICARTCTSFPCLPDTPRPRA